MENEKDKVCPRKIRDKEQRDVNEFFECYLEKVSSGGSKARGDNCDTRLDINRSRLTYEKPGKSLENKTA